MLDLFFSVSLPFLCHHSFVFLKHIRYLLIVSSPYWDDVIFCTVSNGTCEISFQFVMFFALFPMGHVKFRFKSVQIILNNVMLKRKLNLTVKKQETDNFMI